MCVHCLSPCILGRRVAAMKKGCILLNVSRGGLVENAALVSGLESRQLGGVGMDVYENEGRCGTRT